MYRVIIFCQRYDDYAVLYKTFLNSLGKELTEPVGAPNAEVKITCGHRSNSVRFITMTDHNCS